MSVTSTPSKLRGKLTGLRLFDSPIMPPLITFAGALILFWLFVPHFGTMRTMSSITNAAAINATVVIGVTMLMISGEFDLSVGAVVAMSGFVYGKHVMGGGSPLVGIALALSVAAVMGLINGTLTVTTEIPSFIVTLGTRSIFRAVAWIYSGGLMLQSTHKLPGYELFAGRLDILNDLFAKANLRTTLLWALIIGILFQLLLVRTRFGNQVFATGGSPQAAIAQGVRVKRVKIACFVLTSMLAGLAGVMTFSRFTTIFVASATGLELKAIAAAVVGGTMLTGGVGSIVGALLGIFLISMLRSGVVLAGLPSDNFEAIVGLTIIAAAVLNEKLRSRY